jgi:hypothetical protein
MSTNVAKLDPCWPGVQSVAQEDYLIYVEEGEESFAADPARSLADDLREASGVVTAERRKDDQSTMDLGAVVTIVATSGAALAIAQGIADWLRRRRGATLKIERDPSSGAIKALVENIDPATAVRITEIVRGT